MARVVLLRDRTTVYWERISARLVLLCNRQAVLKNRRAD